MWVKGLRAKYHLEYTLYSTFSLCVSGAPSQHLLGAGDGHPRGVGVDWIHEGGTPLHHPSKRLYKALCQGQCILCNFAVNPVVYDLYNLSPLSV